MSQVKGQVMEGQVTEEKIPIKTAADMLNVSVKTIHRYLAKGRLTRVKEGTHTQLLLSEVEQLRGDPSSRQGHASATICATKGTGQVGDTVTLSRERYEELLLELGELRMQNHITREFKGLLQAQEESIRRLELDVDQLRDRVRALEMRKHKQLPDAAQDAQKPGNEPDEGKAKGKKPWWQA
jgi:excisionase family DNA binding protein